MGKHTSGLQGPYNCLIVDDEQPARQLLARLIEQRTDINLIATCKSTSEASSYLKEHSIPLMLLDIEMPQQTGIEFLRELVERPYVILTTAYPQYALQGYELEVGDYVLKPIAPKRLYQALDRAVANLKQADMAASFQAEQDFTRQTLRIRSGYDVHDLRLSDIRYISAETDYVCYYTSARKYLELNSLRELESQLPSEHFMRVHRSYIVAYESVTGRQGQTLLLRDGTEIPVGKTYRKRVNTRW